MKIDKIEQQNFKKAVRITTANKHQACKSLLVNKSKYFENPRCTWTYSFIYKLREFCDNFIIAIKEWQDRQNRI
jgi:hypothetical protein